MSHDQERIAVLETEIGNLKDEILDLKDLWKAVDDRIREVERCVWKAIGALAAADLAMRLFFK